MSDELFNPQSGENQASMDVVVQYIKDISFENPQPLHFLSKDNPEFDTQIEFDVIPQPVGDTFYEVVLDTRIRITEGASKEVVYLMELKYAGFFKITGANDELLQLLLRIECPRQLFPFASAQIANLTRESGFPPLFLRPVNFMELLRQKIEAETGGKGNQGSGDGSDKAN